MSKRLDWEELGRRSRAERLNALASDTDRRWKQRIRKAQEAEKLRRLAASLARQRELKG